MIQDRVAEGELSSARVRAAIDEVLSREEFAPPGDDTLIRWLAAKVAAVVRKLLELFGFSDVDFVPVFGAFFYFLLGLALAAVLWMALRFVGALRRGRGARAEEPESSEAVRQRRVADLRAEARRAADQGDLVRALRLNFTALVIGLSERGDLEYRDAWTNRELFERGAPRSDAARELAALVPALDRKSFGREPAERADVEHLATLCDRWLGEGAGTR